MTVALRPMSLGEILDRTFQIYRARFLVSVGIAAIPALAMTLLQVANIIWWRLYPQPWEPSVLFGVSSVRLLYLVVLYQVNLLFLIAVWPLFAGAVSRHFRTDQSKVAPKRGRWRSFTWLGLATWGTILLVPELAFFGLLVGVAALLFEVLKLNSPEAEHSGPGMFFLTVGLAWASSLWLMARLSFAPAAWQVEGLTVVKALKRSWRLAKGTQWRVFFAWLLPMALQVTLAAALGWVLMMFRSSCIFDGYRIYRLKVALVPGWSPGCLPISLVEGARAFASMLISILIGPLYPIAITLFYYDQRIRKEGYDIEHLMNAAGLNAAAAPVAVAAATSQAGDSVGAEVQAG